MSALLEIRIKNLESRIKVFFAYFFILIALFSPTIAFANESTESATQSATQSATLPSTYYPLPATVSPTSPAYTDLIVHNMFHTFSCLTVGGSIIGQPCLTYQIQKDHPHIFLPHFEIRWDRILSKTKYTYMEC